MFFYEIKKQKRKENGMFKVGKETGGCFSKEGKRQITIEAGKEQRHNTHKGTSDQVLCFISA